MNLRGVVNLYSWKFPRGVVLAFRKHYSAHQLVRWFWTTESFDVRGQLLGPRGNFAAFLLGAAMLAQVGTGVTLLIDWARFGTAGAWAFGLALIVAYPIVWVHLAAAAWLLWRFTFYLTHPKKLGRAVVCNYLESQVRELRRRHRFTVVAVAGSVGKTTTKHVVAQLLKQTKRVRYQAGNYNDRVTVPLVFFGQEEPSLLNIPAWLRIFRANAAQLAGPFPYDVVVVELGTDGPGFMREFAYVRPDIAVLTAVAPEHMEYFKTLDAVAAEELAVGDFAAMVLVNGDDIPGKYLAGRTFRDYSVHSSEAHYFAVSTGKGLQPQQLQIKLGDSLVSTTTSLLGLQGAKCALAAAAVADMLGMPAADIVSGIPALEPFAGRMQMLTGLHGAKLIDDTYNASPVSVKAALDVLYSAKSSQKIAILGSMNELGDYAREAHREVGAYCDPTQLTEVITIGADAKKYIAPAARKRGCQVKSFLSPYDAGTYVATKLQKNAIVLAKGSQNKVFAEEALKALLADPAEAGKLVRQSVSWMEVKRRQFNG